MNIVLVGEYNEIVKYSNMLNESYDLIIIDGNMVLNQNKILKSRNGDQNLFNTVFTSVMLKHLEKMAFHQLKTGFVFIKYPNSKSNIKTIERKYNAKIDLIIDLSNGKMIDDLNKSDVPIITIDTDKDSQEIGDDIRKESVRTFMKKIISI